MVNKDKMISQSMINKLNDQLLAMKCSFIVKEFNSEDGTWQLALPSYVFVDSYIINTTDKFDEFLIDFFKQYGIEINFNNTHGIFWSKSQWVADAKGDT